MAFLDWTRGLAALIMLQGHTFHSFSRPELRTDGPYMLSQFFGGIAPAIFLFLTGITLAFLMDSREKLGWSPVERVLAAVRRAGYLLLVAMLFRLQLWLFGLPYSPWTDLFRVDILNCMALATLAMAGMAVFQNAERARLCAVLGVLIATVSPLISAVEGSWGHPLIKAYLAPSFTSFSFFPWAAFLAFGVSAGSVLRQLKPIRMNRAMQWATLLGFGLILGGQYFSNLPYSFYTKSEYWLDSPSLVAVKLGVVLLIGSFAFLWTTHGHAARWSWIRQIGTTSLLVYWVHIEIVYGRWLGFWKESLTNVQVTIFAVVLIVAMLGLSVMQTRWWRLRIPSLASLLPASNPRRASGD